MLDKKSMTEEEIKLNYITPAITDKWSKSSIRMEFYFTDGVFVDFVKETIPDAGNIADYDVLSYIGYGRKPLTKDERVDRILVSGYLEKFSKDNQDIIRLLLDAYRTHDIDELTNMRILNMPEFVVKGTPLSF